MNDLIDNKIEPDMSDLSHVNVNRKYKYIGEIENIGNSTLVSHIHVTQVRPCIKSDKQFRSY